MKKACIHVGDAIWTLTYEEHNDNTVTIANFDKEDNDGYMFHKTLPVLQSIKTSNGQIAEHVTIDGVTHEVRNKQNVYTYKQPL